MTVSAAPVEQPTLRLTTQTVIMLSVAALAWAGVIAFARHMGNGIGTMGMPLVEFLPMWALMMTAMMLPAVAPVAALVVRTIRSDRTRRLFLFVGGYLVVWTAAGIPAYFALRVVDDRVAESTTTMRTIAVVVLAAAGIYQLTPLKAVSSAIAVLRSASSCTTATSRAGHETSRSHCTTPVSASVAAGHSWRCSSRSAS
jgi:hypothetical protein